jgi:hypothetical protein
MEAKREILALAEEGYSHKNIGLKFGICQIVITRILESKLMIDCKLTEFRNRSIKPAEKRIVITIPCKPKGFEVQVTEYPESDTGETKTKMVKVKPRRDPPVLTSATYKMSYIPWAGHKVEDYCKLRAILDKYIRQAPIRNINERVPASK